MELWRMSDFKADGNLSIRFGIAAACFGAGRFGEPMQAVHLKVFLVRRFGVVAVADKQHVGSYVFLHYKPWSAAKAQALALSDGVEPQSFVLSYLPSCLQFHHIACLFAKIAAHILVVVDVAQEANTLRILTLGIDRCSRSAISRTSFFA